jgi:hypothetical protein
MPETGVSLIVTVKLVYTEPGVSEFDSILQPNKPAIVIMHISSIAIFFISNLLQLLNPNTGF